MPRYFFHQRTQGGFIEDPDGSDLPGLDAVREEALAGARSLWAAAILHQQDLCGEAFEVHDDTGRRVLTVGFDEALPVRLRGHAG